MNHFEDNSTHINGDNNTGNQFGAGSKDFQGTINNISIESLSELEKLTNELIGYIQQTPIDGVATEELTDAIKQVETQAKQKTINKLSIKGLLSGISMVIQTGKNISDDLHSIYTNWSTYIDKLFF